MSVLLGACAELVGTLMHQFTVGKNVGGAVHPLFSAFLNVRQLFFTVGLIRRNHKPVIADPPLSALLTPSNRAITAAGWSCSLSLVGRPVRRSSWRIVETRDHGLPSSKRGAPRTVGVTSVARGMLSTGLLPLR
jgi:hypothetical protein